MKESEHIRYGDLGPSRPYIYEIVKNLTNSKIVELGAGYGESSQIFLLNSDTNNNKLYSIDVSFSLLPQHIQQYNNFIPILGDSPTIGKYWIDPVDVLFVDTFHIKQQVLCELYYWYSHIKNNGYIIFHDTNWPEDKYDAYGGINWPRPEEAIKVFFGINQLNYEDEFIQSKNYPEGFGLTIIKIKQKKDFVSLYKNWNKIFEDRNHLISLFWNEHNKNNIKIDLNLQP
jgi:hypothetical protein